jgi:hypothetical protein
MQHLTERQILAWQLNEQTPGERKHVDECDRCRAEVMTLQGSLSLYRASVHGWSESRQVRAGKFAWAPPSRWQMWRRPVLQWASAAALTLAVGAPVYTHRVIEERREQRAQADQALLEQVDREVSQTIPDTMEPLTQLVQWDPSDSDTDSSTKTRRTQ